MMVVLVVGRFLCITSIKKFSTSLVCVVMEKTTTTTKQQQHVHRGRGREAEARAGGQGGSGPGAGAGAGEGTTTITTTDPRVNVPVSKSCFMSYTVIVFALSFFSKRPDGFDL